AAAVLSVDMSRQSRRLEARTRPVRVLIVDDHALFAEALMLTLGIDRRIEVVGHASNGVEAVSLARALEPEVVLMDLHMPRMDGAIVTALVDGDAVVEAVEGRAESFGLEVGTHVPFVKTYCQRMLRGRLPSVVRDAANDPRTADLPVTHEAGIGAYVGVPI